MLFFTDKSITLYILYLIIIIIVVYKSDEWYKTFTESVANKLAKTLAFWANLWVKARKLKKWERVE